MYEGHALNEAQRETTCAPLAFRELDLRHRHAEREPDMRSHLLWLVLAGALARELEEPMGSIRVAAPELPLRTDRLVAKRFVWTDLKDGEEVAWHQRLAPAPDLFATPFNWGSADSGAASNRASIASTGSSFGFWATSSPPKALAKSDRSSVSSFATEGPTQGE